MKELEDFGLMTAEMTDSTRNFDYRGALAYCKKKGIEPPDMTDEEVEMFVRKENIMDLQM